MLMVIFGAGASYDSSLDEVTSAAGRPPLAQHLFDNRAVFNRAIAKYPACRPLVSQLRDLARREAPPVLEDVLAEMLERSQHNVETRRQLFALRFYLREAIGQQAAGWMDDTAGLTNYGRLLRRIGDWRTETDERVVLVTFNYDEMLDTALIEQMAVGDVFLRPEDYVRREDWRLCKLHGSTNWVRTIRVDGAPAGGDNATYVIGAADSLDFRHGEVTRGAIQETIERVDDSECQVSIPAIAIPTTSKSTFETHQSHIEAFEAAVPQVDRLLIIGWRGIEQHVLERLKAINPHYVLGIVDPGADAVFSQLLNAVVFNLGNGRAATVGNRAVRRYTWPAFSELVRANDVDAWLRIRLPTSSRYGEALTPWSSAQQ